MSTQAWLGAEHQELAAERILDAAQAILHEDGIRAFRMGRVAEAAGCSRATLYRYFPNRDSLLQAYMVREAEHFQRQLGQRLGRCKSFAEQIVEGVVGSLELIRQRQQVAPFFTEEGMGLTNYLAANLEAQLELVARGLEQASNADGVPGGLRRGVSPRQAAEWMTRIILSFAAMQGPPRSPTQLRHYLRLLLVPALAED